MRASDRAALCLMLVAVLSTSPLLAASKKDPEKEALRRMQMQIRQAENEKAAVEQEKAALGQELEALKKKSGEIESSVAHANRSRAAAEKQVEALKQDKSVLTGKVEQLEKQLGESQQNLRETRQNLQQETSHKQRLEQTLGVRGKELASCETKNKMLYQYQVEMINRAQSRGTFDALLEHEPFTQLKRVEIENILEEYRDKIDKERVDTVIRTTADEAR